MLPSIIAFFVGLTLAFLFALDLTKRQREQCKKVSLTTDYTFVTLVMMVIFWGAIITANEYSYNTGLALVVGYWFVYPICYMKHKFLKRN